MNPYQKERTAVDMKHKRANKRKPGKFAENLGDALGELILGAVFFGIGALIVYAFGGNPFGENADFEGMVILGMVAFLITIFIIALIVSLIRKKNPKKTDDMSLAKQQEEQKDTEK